MFHVDNNSAVPVMPAVKPVVSAVTSFFTEGGNGVPPTYPGPDWFNIIQSELLAVLAAAGITPDKASNVQLLAAMRALFLDTSQNGADIQDKALFLKNLGLKEAAKRDVGVGAGQIPDMSSFTASRATTGWQKLPGGLIIQWGQAATNTSSLVAVAYPIPFPNNVFQVIGSCLDVNNADIVAINSTDGVNFNLVAWVATSGSVLRTTTPVKWIAIGN